MYVTAVAICMKWMLLNVKPSTVGWFKQRIRSMLSRSALRVEVFSEFGCHSAVWW